MTEKWEQHKWIFVEDGGLLDIYVRETTLDDWMTLIDFLNENYKLKYWYWSNEEGEISEEKINKDYVKRLLTDTSGELDFRFLSVYIDSLIIACYFFLDEIELDVSPGMFKGQHDFDTLIVFMRTVSQLLNKEIILTFEGEPDSPVITVDSRRDLLKIIPQERF